MININEIQNNIEAKAEELGIDLQAFGNASPTKIIVEAIKFAGQAMQTAALVSLTEQNPLAATSLKSKLGLAYLSGLNYVQNLSSSAGYVMIKPNGMTLSIKQHGIVRSDTGYAYYLDLPSETVQIQDNTEFLVYQGSIKTITVSITNERYQTIVLQSNGIVPHKSVAVYYQGTALSIGYSLTDNADAYLAINSVGELIVIIDKNYDRIAGDYFTIDYVDSLGSYGDNTVVGTVLTGSGVAYNGDDDVSNDITITISKPIIGGTDYQNMLSDLGVELMLGSKNNLIGNSEQLLQYVKRFKQYVIQKSTITDGVLTLSVLRNLQTMVASMDYWTATKSIVIDDNDISSLNLHLKTLSSKSQDLLIDITPATAEYCTAIINVKMPVTDTNSIATVLIDYALSEIYSRNYEIGKLYKALYDNTSITEAYCKFEGNTNDMGTATPTALTNILVINKAIITANGITVTYE
jgi:hypothetical protein